MSDGGISIKCKNFINEAQEPTQNFLYEGGH